MSDTKLQQEVGPGGRFGTFGGVFTPCTLTILGVIMFMRAGWVVGEGGLIGALAILGIAKLITTLTTLSLSAISTNTEVKTGGVYYIISRTLGHDFGGSIGLTLFVSQAISIAFYVIGFSEALFGLMGSVSPLIVKLTSSGVIFLIFLITFKGADLAIKAQYPILIVLLASVVSFIIGGVMEYDGAQFTKNLTAPSGGADFWLIFAIFFPAATGITAGANMSGDLKDPAKSIPRGTLASIIFTATIYVILLVLLAAYAPAEAMGGAQDNAFRVLKDMSIWSPLIVAGVFAATLSSALGSFLGAPRILQAMGKDRILKPLAYFGVGHGPNDEPRRATVLSLFIAIAVVWAGDLNAVAGVISMFFLIAYGMINLSAFVEARAGNPSFRPRFKRFGWPASMVGAICCVIAMLKIDETTAIAAILIAGMIYFYLRGREAEWGDAKRGFIFARVRDNLMLLEKTKPHPKNWRPILAVVTDDAERDAQMIACASWVENRRGILSVLEVIEKPDMDVKDRVKHGRKRDRLLSERLEERGIRAFGEAVVTPNADAMLDTILQTHSIGSLRPNTLMVSIPPPSLAERREHLADNLRTAAAFGRNLLLYKGARLDGLKRRRIDLWWHGQQNGSLLALLAYLASTHPDWTGSRVRLLRAVRSHDEHLEAERDLHALIDAARLDMDVEIVMQKGPILDLIADTSGASDLVMMGLAETDVLDFAKFLESRDAFLAKLPPTLLVLSNGEVDLLA